MANDRGRIADKHPDENRQTSDDALEQYGNQQDGHDGHGGRHGSLLDVIPCRRSQVETNEGNDSPRHNRWHNPVNPGRTREVN